MALSHGQSGGVYVSAVTTTDALSTLIGTNSDGSGGVTKPYNFSIDVQGASAEVGGFGDVFNSSAAGPGQWSATVSARYPQSSPQLGALASMSGSTAGDNLYTANVTGFSLNLAAQSFGPVFALSSSANGVQWASFAPGLVSANGTFDAIIDDTTSLAMNDTGASSLSTGEFRITTGTAVDNAITIPFVQTGPSISSRFDDFNRVTYSFVSSGAIEGSGDDNLIGAGTLTRPEIQEVTFRADSGVTYTGEAFWSGVSITVAPDQAIDVSMNLQGTGALTAS